MRLMGNGASALSTLIFSCLATACTAGLSLAAPVYGPNMPARDRWFMGCQTNLVFERNMRKGLGEAESVQYFYDSSYGIYDWFSFDGKLGIGDTAFDTREAGGLSLKDGFAGGYGVRFRIYNNEGQRLKAIFGFQHISAHPPCKEVNNVKYSAIWDEWQLSLLVATTIGDRWQPYVGAKASQLYIIRRDNQETDWRWNGARDHVGLFAGVSFEMGKDWYLNVDGRLIDETAVSAGIHHRL